ncbi:virulence plasmid B protein [Pseudomonas sp. GM50]|uniref:SpvB/TcaC N-terminal domain-containing protein n=1 Tax=Pseudomonas sp. GM50 TaxID=1144332 RepID=UPI000270C784|nr:SpvB/TcaC N-terminal domain-containing protein [Pseudomonas sp. GM50]EJM65724.1 virulence plasmid B protein [Pseudomonas sp. GM50]
MNQPSAPLEITAPTLPKGGGAIASLGRGWGAVGTSGAASLGLPLPITKAPNRDMVPALALGYSSEVGNSPFGIGWKMTVHAITLRTTKGVPLYDGSDLVVGPGGDVWMPERDEQGELIVSPVTIGEPAKTYQVARYWPRIEGGFDLIQRYYSDDDPAGFWVIRGADATVQVYGKTLASRRAEALDENNPHKPERIGVWLLDESLNARGEHVVYEYKAEEEEPVAPQLRDYRAQRYLHRVLYGNAEADPQLYAWQADGNKGVQFHFHLLFDYGERSIGLSEKPVYGPPYSQPDDQYGDWLERSDPFWNYAYGFEIGTRRLCRQVLMFHHFPAELGEHPVLVQRLLLQHRASALGYNHLTAAHLQAYDNRGKVQNLPPMEFGYAPFELKTGQKGWQPFPQMAGLNDGQHYQFVDLYGKGMPGVLLRTDQAWYYREPLRADAGGDEVVYDDWQVLPNIPVADSSQPIRQTLSDLNGDGKLEWGLHAPAYSGFFTLKPDRSWSTYVPYKAFPTEFFHPQAQLADLVGDGRSDVVLIGHNSVRLYPNLGDDKGFDNGADVDHHENDALPLQSNAETEIVAFGDVLGSGQQHLIRLRHDTLECWPNLGHGRFGKKILLSTPTFAYEKFNAAQVLLADLDGSGAVDLIYLESERIRVFMNHSGEGFASESIDLPWPEGVRYDRLCQVSTADVQGLGCTSLILTLPHMSPRHWRYDFIKAKPYLLNRTSNNMGASSLVDYRSSAQEFLDEEKEQHDIDKDRIVESGVPFAVHLAKRQTQIDEITGNRLTQTFSYRDGYYDPFEREFRGFGLLLQTDTEANEAERARSGFTPPILAKTWFHNGKQVDLPRTGYYSGDDQAVPLGSARLERYHARDRAAEPIDPPDEGTAREMARALSGSVLRTEVFAADTPVVPYAVTEHRFLIRLLRPKGEYQPYTVMQPMALESISYQYEPQMPDDPRCEHTLNLEWDEYGFLTHAFTMYYARRTTENDAPPFADQYENQWWSDAHDPAQQCWYATQSKAQYIHIKETQARRLGLPYRQRGNALVLDKNRLSPADICHENLLEWSKDDGDWAKHSVMTGLSRQFYIDLSGQLMESGQATIEALAGYTETAELDATALSAYDKLKDEQGNMPFNLKAKLESPEVGYHIMKWFLPEVEEVEPDDPGDAKNYLWSVHHGFPTYHGLDGFYNVRQFRQTQSHGDTTVTYDPYWCLPVAVELPDGCITRTLNTDYRSFLPAAIEDPNRNIQEACYNAFGEVLVTSFYGTELGEKVGFHSLRNYLPADDNSPARAIEFPREAIGNFASAIFTDPFSWMGRVSGIDPPTAEWLAWAESAGFVLPDGHLCDRARQHLQDREDLSPDERILQHQLNTAQREPVHVVTLQADRYPGDPELQIRIAIIHQDGFARVLQTKQEVEPGKAWVVAEDGTLRLKDDNTPLEAEATRRWRVSEPFEYNNKGQKVRIYRPYFADQPRRIHDHSLREHAYYDEQFYDAAGRPTRTLLAKKPLREEKQYRCWYEIFFDANDTYEEAMAEWNEARQAKT